MSSRRPAVNLSLLNQHEMSKQFYAAASQCNDECVRDFNSKNLDINEKDCISACYERQQIILNAMKSNLEDQK